MNRADSFRNVLKTHRLRPKGHEIMEKCTGCPWIGYIHLEHVVDELLKTFDEESQ